MSLFLLTTAIGDLLVGIVYNSLRFLSFSQLYYSFATLMLLNTVLFAWIAKDYAVICTRAPLVSAGSSTKHTQQDIELEPDTRLLAEPLSDLVPILNNYSES
jgi:hypothetical protein